MNKNVFLRKSEFNQKAVNLLIKEGLPAPSVHCSYYSCILQMLYIIYGKLGYTKDSFDKYLKQKSNNPSSHKKTIQLIKGYLWEKRYDFDHNLYKNFQKDIGELKSLRVKADYTDQEISNDVGRKAKDLSVKILGYLKELK